MLWGRWAKRGAAAFDGSIWLSPSSLVFTYEKYSLKDFLESVTQRILRFCQFFRVDIFLTRDWFLGGPFPSMGIFWLHFKLECFKFFLKISPILHGWDGLLNRVKAFHSYTVGLLNNLDFFDYSLLSILLFSIFQAVGKTCVVQRFKSGTFYEKQASTIGVDFVVKSVVLDGYRIKVFSSFIVVNSLMIIGILAFIHNTLSVFLIWPHKREYWRLFIAESKPNIELLKVSDQAKSFLRQFFTLPWIVLEGPSNIENFTLKRIHIQNDRHLHKLAGWGRGANNITRGFRDWCYLQRLTRKLQMYNKTIQMCIST